MLGSARAFVVLLSIFMGESLASAVGVPSAPKMSIQDASLSKPNWIFHRKFSYKKDQVRLKQTIRTLDTDTFTTIKLLNGPKRVDARPNQTFEMPTSDEQGLWEVQTRGDGTRGMTDFWVLTVPQDEQEEVVISYEIAVTRGRFQPTSVRFAPEGMIYLIDRKSKSKGKGKGANDTGRKAKMKIGTFRVDMKTLPPIIDRAFTSFNR